MNYLKKKYAQNVIASGGWGWHIETGFHDPDLLAYVIKKVGDEHVMFSTDFPFNPQPILPTYRVRRKTWL